MTATAIRSHRSSVRATDAVGWSVAAGVAVLYMAAAFARHWNYWSGGFDLGIFDQGVWLLSRGHAPEVTIIGRSLFADHFSPVLLLFVPLYRVAASPLWLLAAQAVALAVTVVPLRALARDLGVRPSLPTVAVALSAPLFAASLFDFHPAALAVPFLGWAVLAVHRSDPRMATWAAVGVVACRGDLAWTLVVLAVLAAGAARRRLVVVGLAGLVLAAVVPAAFGAHGHWDVHYGDLGDGPLDALLHPWRAVDALLSEGAARTIGLALLPVGFLPLLRPRWAAAIVVAALPLLLSAHDSTHLPWFHYGAPLVPLSVAAAIEALASSPGRIRVLALGAGVAAALAVASPLAADAPDDHRLWRVLSRDSGVDYERALAAVASHEPVSAVHRALPHLTHRREVWSYPLPFEEAPPRGIGAAPDPAATARIRIVLVGGSAVEQVANLGFRPTDVDAGRLEVWRRP